MQKMLFIASISMMQDLVVEAGLTLLTIKKKETVQKECKKSYDLLGKSMKSLFKSNDEPFSAAKYDEKMGVIARRFSLPTSKEVFVAGICNRVLLELKKHKGSLVYNDNGSVFTKTATDKKRFADLHKSVEVILKSVS